MSILVRFTGAPSLTAEKYDETQRRIEESGKFPPDGLEYHVAFSSGGAFRVSEIWDSREQFEAFGEKLKADGVKARVVSMPSWEIFEDQDDAYKTSVLPPEVSARVSVELASSFGWERYVGCNGAKIGMK